MTKYTYDLKLQIVQAYLSGTRSLKFLANQYGIPSSNIIGEWVTIYNTLGPSGLQRKRQNTVYNSQFKLNAVNLYFKYMI